MSLFGGTSFGPTSVFGSTTTANTNPMKDIEVSNKCGTRETPDATSFTSKARF